MWNPKKIVTYVLNLSYLVTLLIICSGCAGTSTIKMDRNIANRVFDIPRINKKGTSLFVTQPLVGGLVAPGYLECYITKSNNSQLNFRITDADIAANTVFSWIVTPGTASGTNSLGGVIWYNPTANNMKYVVFDIENVASGANLTPTTVTGAQSGVTRITMATNTANTIAAAWDVTLTQGVISQYTILTPDGEQPGVALDLIDAFLFTLEFLDGSTPPQIALDDNGLLCGVQAGIVTGPQNSTEIGGKIISVTGSGSAFYFGAFTPASPGAVVTVKSCSTGFYMISSTYLATAASQVQNANEYLVITSSNNQPGFGDLTFPGASALSSLFVTKIVPGPSSDITFTPITSFSNNPAGNGVAVVCADLVETSILAQGETVPTSGLFLSCMLQGVSTGSIMKLIQNDTASPFTPAFVNLAIAGARNATTILSISSTTNFSNFVAYLTSSSPARIQVVNVLTGALVLDQEVTSVPIANSLVQVNDLGSVIVFWEDTQGNIFSETFDVGVNSYSKLNQAIKRYSPIKFLRAL